MTPLGRDKVAEQVSGLDLVALQAEAATDNAPMLGQTQHLLVPPTLSDHAASAHPLRDFLLDHPFDSNVFGIDQRFPGCQGR